MSCLVSRSSIFLTLVINECDVKEVPISRSLVVKPFHVDNHSNLMRCVNKVDIKAS